MFLMHTASSLLAQSQQNRPRAVTQMAEVSSLPRSVLETAEPKEEEKRSG